MKSKAVKLISAGILLVLAAGLLIRRLSVRDTVPGTESFFGMDTIMTMTVYGEDADRVILKAKERIRELEEMLSVTRTGSEVSSINHAGGNGVKVSPDMVYITKKALEYARLTEGAFDITLYPLSKMWGFTDGDYRIPSKEEIINALSHTGFAGAEVDGDTGEIRIPEGFMLDFGAIAKGYAGDETLRIMKEAGISSAIVNLGGSISLIGGKPDGKPWNIAIKAPSLSGSAGTLSLKDVSVVTSGKHERFFTGDDGREYCHIMDPSTGSPVVTELDSITVICDSAMKGDALSTAFFVWGMDRTRDFLKEHGDVEVVAVSGTRIYLTEGIRDLFHPSKGYEILPFSE